MHTDNAPYWSDLADSLVWAAGAKYDSVFVVGIKVPGSARGVWRGNRLIDRAASHAFVATLVQQQLALRIVREDSAWAPRVQVRIPSLKAFSAVRKLPFVDYIEPVHIEIFAMSSDQCTAEPLTQPVITEGASNGYADTLSAIMPSMGIPDAWMYSKGDGIMIGITGEGIDDSYDAPFGVGHYATVDSYGRDPFYQNTTGAGPDKLPVCDHETRLANIAAAPRDGRGVVGVAYRSAVYSNYFEDGVYAWNETDAADALYHTAAFTASRVMTLAWGSYTGSQAISDAVDGAYYEYDELLVGAAGTCPHGLDDCPSMGSAVFPASKGEVLAASGSNWNGTRPTDNYDWGSTIEGVLAYTRIATVGLGTGSPSELNGSSAPTGIIGGVAALVRSLYPTMNNYAVVHRILDTYGDKCHDAPPQWRNSMVNVVAAVGGPCVSPISGPTGVAIVGTSQSVTATYSFTMSGDNSANYIVSWQRFGQVGMSTQYTFWTDDMWQSYTDYVRVTVTDPATGVSVTRSLPVSVYVNQNCRPHQPC